jgi:hypothetical protein
MKKIEYKTPEMEVIKFNMRANVLLNESGTTPGKDDEQSEDPF